jgi:mono/diheme cytochrome c family protein
VKDAARVAVALGVLLSGCDTRENFKEPEWTLSRMLAQPRYDPYAASDFFVDGRSMRPPVAGAVSRDAVVGPADWIEGAEHGQYAEHVPVAVTRELLVEGRERFEVICATCHGVLGDGRSMVATKMQLRRPPSLHEPSIVEFPPGRVYRVITMGYGLMPAIDYQLNTEQRWAVVAYVKALQKSQATRVRDLPRSLQEELARAAP